MSFPAEFLKAIELNCPLYLTKDIYQSIDNHNTLKVIALKGEAIRYVAESTVVPEYVIVEHKISANVWDTMTVLVSALSLIKEV